MRALQGLSVSLHEMQQPVVPRPTHAVRRGADVRAHSRYGMIVGGANWQAAIAHARERGDTAATKKAATEKRFWSNHRASIRAAEQALAGSSGDASQLGVGQLKELIISRTGHVPKAKNNTGGALLGEAMAALTSQPNTLLPPTPPQTPPRESATGAAQDDVGDGVSDAGDSCPRCAVLLEDVEPARDENGILCCGGCHEELD
jgi:hypothetical protein